MWLAVSIHYSVRLPLLTCNSVEMWEPQRPGIRRDSQSQFPADPETGCRPAQTPLQPEGSVTSPRQKANSGAGEQTYDGSAELGGSARPGRVLIPGEEGEEAQNDSLTQDSQRRT